MSESSLNVLSVYWHFIKKASDEFQLNVSK